MSPRRVLWIMLSLPLFLGSCTSENSNVTENSGIPNSPNTDSPSTHVWGCILMLPLGDVPDDLYQETGIIQTDEYKPFTKIITVHGLTLLGQAENTDAFMLKVAQTVAEVLPKDGEGIDSVLQKELIENLYKYKAAIPLALGNQRFGENFTDEQWVQFENIEEKNSICDVIHEGEPGPGQVNEVIEHILHFVTDVGFYYTFPDEWGISTTSMVYAAMQEAIDRRYYDVAGYDDNNRDYLRIIIQEFSYWVIFTAWDLMEPYGPEAEWTGINNPTDLQNKLPQSYQLFERTVPKVMVSPHLSTLEEFTH